MGPDGITAINIESAVAPIHHIFGGDISDFAFGFEHFEDFIAKQLFKLTGIRRWAYQEISTFHTQRLSFARRLRSSMK